MMMGLSFRCVCVCVGRGGEGWCPGAPCMVGCTSWGACVFRWTGSKEIHKAGLPLMGDPCPPTSQPPPLTEKLASPPMNCFATKMLICNFQAVFGHFVQIATHKSKG